MMLLNDVKSFLVTLSIMAPLATRVDTFFADSSLLFGAALVFLLCLGCVRLQEAPPATCTGQKLEEEAAGRRFNLAREDDGHAGAGTNSNGNTPDQGQRKRKRRNDDDGEAERCGPSEEEKP
jgi:hypothetical protein